MGDGRDCGAAGVPGGQPGSCLGDELGDLPCGISLVAFLLANLAPGDPAELILNSSLEQPPTQAQLEQFRLANGLDNPIALQYLNWVAGLVRGDLGTSFRSGQPVLEEIGARFPATLQITVPAFGLALLLAILIGVLSACAASAGRW